MRCARRDRGDIAAALANATLYATAAGSTGFWDSLSDNTSVYTLWARGATQLSDAEAITLGHDIYFRNLPMQNSPGCLPIIGHELFHGLHVEIGHVGRPLWLTSYVLDLAKHGYNGNISEIVAYATSDTISYLLQKYPNLFQMIQSGTAEQKIPGLRKEIQRIFQQYLKQRLVNRTQSRSTRGKCFV